MRKKNNPLGNGEMYTGRQRNVQLYIYTNDGVWSAPVFFSQQKEITYNWLKHDELSAAIPILKSMDGMLTSEILRWLIDWGARATTSHFQEEEKRQNNRKKGEYEGWISRVFISFKEAGSVLVQLHTWLGHGKLCYLFTLSLENSYSLYTHFETSLKKRVNFKEKKGERERFSAISPPFHIRFALFAFFL
jgi:hypothetical protein